jgi:hypothetical protein
MEGLTVLLDQHLSGLLVTRGRDLLILWAIAFRNKSGDLAVMIIV